MTRTTSNPLSNTLLAVVICLVAAAPLLLAAEVTEAVEAAPAAETAAGPKVLCIGFDGMDPQMLREYMAAGDMPNFARLIEAGDFKELGTSMPPQSPVAWSNFITGMDPGGHGIFDFIHRDPATLIPYLSMSRASSPAQWWEIGDWRIPRGGGSVELLRDGEAFWEPMAAAGIDVTIFKVPSNFPPVECEARSLSGMGTPDILGTYGIFSYYTDDPPADTDIGGGRIVPVTFADGRVETTISGPVNSYRSDQPEATVPLTITLDAENDAALFAVAGETFLLGEGEWSPWLTLDFQLVPMLKSVSGVCRLLLMETAPKFRLYATPVNIDPYDPEMPISTPAGYSREIAEAIDSPYYTQGLPEDTKALEEGVLDDDSYVSQSDMIAAERMEQMRVELDRFAGLDRGFLFFYFNVPDQTCHTFWRNMDPDSPGHDEHAARHADRIRRMYMLCDQALGEALDKVGDDSLVIAMSDHGFAPYHRSLHLNRWLLDNGYLVLRQGVEPRDVDYLSGVDWSRTRAYGIGINGLYLNLRGRERMGIVSPGPEHEALVREISAGLEALVDPETGLKPVLHAMPATEIYHGPRVADAPDIVVGCDRGYRVSNESALGSVPRDVISDNLMKWSGDHCMADEVVPGVIVTNRRIDKTDPELLDMGPTFLQLFGLEPLPQMVGRSIFAEGE